MSDYEPGRFTDSGGRGLKDLDRTAGHKFEHYSAVDVYAACHASRGQKHL